MPHRLAAAALLLLIAPGLAGAACDPAGADAADVAAARAAIDAACDCAGAPTPGTYKRCAKTAARAALANPGCLRTVARCAAKSTCGRPGAVTCCRIRGSGDVQGAVVRSAELCRAPRGGSACVGTAASVCDACDASGCTTTCGDGRLDAGEQCDGQPFCRDDCTLEGIGCCQGESTCRELPVFLSSQLAQGCAPDAGVRGTCTAGGTCAPVTVTPDSLCCAGPASCQTSGFADVAQYTTAAYQCLTGGGTPMIGGACGTDGACHPLPALAGVWDVTASPTASCPGAPSFPTTLLLAQTGTGLRATALTSVGSVEVAGSASLDGFTLLSSGPPPQVPCAGGAYSASHRIDGTARPDGGYDVVLRWALLPLVGTCPGCTATATGTMTQVFVP